MKDIKHVVVFDFDGTLIYTAEKTEENIEKVKQKYNYTGRGWWGRKESLDTDIFYPAVNQWVADKFEKAKADPHTLTVLMTGRLIHLDKEVKKILDMHGFEFDRVFLNPNMNTEIFKISKFESLLREFPDASLTMYDDRNEHIIKFREWARRQRGRKVEVVHVN